MTNAVTLERIAQPFTLRGLFAFEQETMMVIYRKWHYLTYGKHHVEGKPTGKGWYYLLDKSWRKLQPNELEIIASCVGVPPNTLLNDLIFGYAYRLRKGMHYIERMKIHDTFPNSFSTDNDQ